MSTVPKLLTVIAIAALLAGCVAEPGVEKVQSEDAAPADAPATTAPPSADNAPPVAVLSATIDGTAATIVDRTLTVPAGTTVVFSSAASSDPDDGTILTYAWTLDGAAAGTEATLTQAFPAAGPHELELTASDGELQATDAVDIVVQAATAAAPTAGGRTATRLVATGLAPPGNLQNPIDGSMVEGGDPIVHTFEVPAGTAQITAILKWVDNEIGANFAPEADIDLALVDAAGVQQGAGGTFTNYEYAKINDTSKIAPGTWSALVTPMTNPVEMEYTLDVVTWSALPTEVLFSGAHTGAHNFGEPGDTAPVDHIVTMPAGVAAVTARLMWYGAGITSPTQARVNICTDGARMGADYDLYVLAGGAEQFRAADGMACEYGQTASSGGKVLPGGDWTFRVTPFIVPDADYWLEVQYL